MGDEIARVTLMATDGHPTWDLSPKDCAALRALLARLRDAERARDEARAPYGWRKPVPEDVHARVVRERDEARAEVTRLDDLCTGYCEDLDEVREERDEAIVRLIAERDEARAALIESVGAWTVQLQDERSRAEAAEARWSAEHATALEALRQAEAAEARVRELEDITTRQMLVERDAAERLVALRAENATLRAIADAAKELLKGQNDWHIEDCHAYGAPDEECVEESGSDPHCDCGAKDQRDKLRAALAARGSR